MDSLREFAAVTMAEMRSSRRLVRTWMFIALSVLVGLLMYLYYVVLHGMFSGLSSTFGFLNPRFLISASSFMVIATFMLAIVFLAFDVRARDARARMIEVLDSRPVGNATLIAGRLTGVVLIAWVPMLVMFALIQGVGAAGLAFDWPFGEPVQPASVFGLLLVDAPLTLGLWCAIVMLLATALRYRLAVVVVALALIGLFFWMIFRVPVYLIPALTGMTSLSYTASDILPLFIDPVIFGQRVCTLLVTVGLVLLAAALHPRKDQQSSAPRFGAAAVLLLLGAGGIGALAWAATGDVQQRNVWVAAHQAQQDAPRVGIDELSGRIGIEPGETLRLELNYELTAPASQSVSELVFSFNPGMTVQAVRSDGETLAFTHEAGLLTIAMPLAAGASARLSIVAEGVPNSAFAYLDAALDTTTLTGQDSQLILMGSEASIYAQNYVALMPGVHWLPTPGAATGREDPQRYGRDYFNVDLLVDVPDGWLVAGPGRRQRENGEAHAFRFRPTAPVPEVALLASAFERQAIEVAGVEIELLMSPKHLRNVAVFDEAAEAIRERVSELFEEAEKLGIGYPYRGLSLVETPGILRSYGGGWRMDSVQSLPGIVALREYGFPTTRFEVRFFRLDELEMDEGGVPAAKTDVLANFFRNDVSGGDPLHGALRNVLAFQTGASGEGAIALDFLVHELASQLVSQRRSGYFAAQTYGDSQDFATVMAQTITSVTTGQGSIGDTVYASATNRPHVWDRALGAALADLSPAEDSIVALNVLWLKVPNIASALIDALGREKVGEVLTELRRRHLGGNFTADDFNAAAAQVGVDMNAIVGDWLRDAALPGFLASDVALFRVADNDQGQPQYQVSVHIRNDEPAPGLVKLVIGNRVGREYFSNEMMPTRVPGESAVELAFITNNLPADLGVWPYLSLNRSHIALALPEVDASEIVDAEPFTGTRASDWRPPADGGIVVDDLDPGFAVQSGDDETPSSVGGFQTWGAPNIDMDEGLPVFPFGFQSWARQESSASWGKYRRTLARAWKGDGDTKAVFTASLPTAGRWRLDFHLPSLQANAVAARATRAVGAVSVSVGSGDNQLGSYDMELLAGETATPVEFDGSAGEVGWNRLGDFDLPAGEVSLTISNETSGAMVVADAIRWRQANAP